MKEYLSDLLTAKPMIGILASISGFVTSILTWFHVITIFLGLLGAAFGAAAGFYTFLLKRREWRNRKNRKHSVGE